MLDPSSPRPRNLHPQVLDFKGKKSPAEIVSFSYVMSFFGLLLSHGSRTYMAWKGTASQAIIKRGLKICPCNPISLRLPSVHDLDQDGETDIAKLDLTELLPRSV